MRQMHVLWNIPDKNPLNGKGKREHASLVSVKSQEAGK